MSKQRRVRWLLLLAILVTVIVLAGCEGADETAPTPVAPTGSEGEVTGEVLTLPALEAVELSERRLEVVATSSIIGGVVQEIGGDAIQLNTLMGPRQDPHSYEPSTGDMAAVADADVIFVNGWGLEEGVLNRLEEIAEYGPVVPISAGITPRMEDGGVDPHVWLDPTHVMTWVRNVEDVLGMLDPEDAPLYEENATAYVTQLEELDEFIRAQVATIPEGERLLVTNHDSLGYFAARYGFEIVGTVIPGLSTGAQPSASGMATLAEAMTQAGVCTIFLEATADTDLAEAVAAEVEGCANVAVEQLYTGTLGPEGSVPGTYIGMMRTNVANIVEGLAD